MYCVSTCSKNYGQRSYLADDRRFFFYSVVLLSRPCLILICATSVALLVPLVRYFSRRFEVFRQNSFLHFSPFSAYARIGRFLFCYCTRHLLHGYITHRADNAAFFFKLENKTNKIDIILTFRLFLEFK